MTKINSLKKFVTMIFRKQLGKIKKQKISLNQGFTLLETLVAITIFLFLTLIIFSIFSNSLASKRRTEVERLLFEETRILMERIVNEMRNNTIDYEEYWSRFEYNASQTGNEFYGQNYGTYALQFLRDQNGDVPESLDEHHRTDANVGLNASSKALRNATNLAVCQNGQVPTLPAEDSGFAQCELYLISADGLTKTILKVFPKTDLDSEYTLKMLKLTGEDSDGDLIPDIWEGTADFSDFTFQNIQPEELKIVNLQFFVSPLEDPRKAFADFQSNIKIQPHVIVQLTVEPNQKIAAGIRGNPPQITLQTTISTRINQKIPSLK